MHTMTNTFSDKLNKLKSKSKCLRKSQRLHYQKTSNTIMDVPILRKGKNSRYE